jgi:hypothetical protein
VTDGTGIGVPGITVSFAASSGGGSVSQPSAITNGSGIATTNLTLGPSGGQNTATATVSGLTGSPVTFNATAAKVIAINGGNNQTGVAGLLLPTQLSVLVTDGTGIGVPGISVSFAVFSGGGSVSQPSAITNGSGIATTNLTLGPSGGQNTATATVSGLTGSPVTFNATAN